MGIALDDMFQYDALAESIRHGEGYTWYGGIPTAARAPLYPLFLAMIYTVFGHQFLAARIVQAMVGSVVPAEGRRRVSSFILSPVWLPAGSDDLRAARY
jgi:hypothetical protein